MWLCVVPGKRDTGSPLKVLSSLVRQKAEGKGAVLAGNPLAMQGFSPAVLERTSGGGGCTRRVLLEAREQDERCVRSFPQPCPL